MFRDVTNSVKGKVLVVSFILAFLGFLVGLSFFSSDQWPTNVGVATFIVVSLIQAPLVWLFNVGRFRIFYCRGSKLNILTSSRDGQSLRMV